jgi:uncharacterized membrane protein YbhN (UPF0104 family)
MRSTAHEALHPADAEAAGSQRSARRLRFAHVFAPPIAGRFHPRDERMISLSPSTKRWLNLLAILASTVLLVVLFRSVDMAQFWVFLRQTDPLWLLVALTCNLLILPAWTQQWRMLMPRARPISTRRMMSVVATTAFMGNAVPATGPASAVVLLSREPGVTRASAVSVVTLDQLVEAVIKIVLLILASRLIPLSPALRETRLVLSIVVFVAFVVLALAARQQRWLTKFTAELDSLRDFKRFAASVAWCAISKSCEALAIIAVQHASGVSLPPSSAVLVLAAVTIGTMIPAAPGNLGTYELTVVAMYRQLGVSYETAFGLAVVQHVCLLLGTVGVGYVQFSLKRVKKWKVA